MNFNVLSNLSTYLFKKISGTSSKHSEEESSEEETMETVEDGRNDLVNGLSLKGYLVPVEVLCSILEWVDPDTLVFSCRLVCKQWKDLVDEFVWEQKYFSTKELLGLRSEIKIPWWVSYWIGKKGHNIFGQNIIKNNCGQEKFKHWTIRENRGDLWLVEDNPFGAMDPIPVCKEIGDRTCCFVTTYQWCSKDQIIKLSDIGLSRKIMDEIQPDFEYSAWITTRFDCGGMYILTISLLDSNHRAIGEVNPQKRILPSGSTWDNVCGSLRAPYPTGATYILFHHKGKDNQFWAGHYGVKVTGCSLKPIFPKKRYIDSCLSQASLASPLENDDV